VARFADVVVALDDGSTDETAAVLAAHPLVEVVISNPRREGYRGWDDRANRQRLLDAVAPLEPHWTMFLDADERIPADDAAALREFLGSEADPRDAYLFRVFRMVGDIEHYDRAKLWVGRLFAHAPRQRLKGWRLHGVPLPAGIRRSRWRKTTFRIQHLASLTEERRRARYVKYREADPGRSEQPHYEHLLDPPEAMRPWYPRSPHLPALANTAHPAPGRDQEGPALSAVVIAHDDEAIIARAVGSVVSQEGVGELDVVVVVSGTDRTAEVVAERFPEVRVVRLGERALPGEARNAGVRAARGRWVSFPGSHVELAAGSLAARLAAHRLGWAMVTGTLSNGTRTPAGWAAYFLDNFTVLPGRPSGPLDDPPVRCSYLRDALLEVGGFPEDMRAGEDTVVNDELFARGYGAYRAREVVLRHHSPCRTPRRMVAHYFQRGRAQARVMVEGRSPTAGRFSSQRVIAHVLGGVPVRLLRATAGTARWGRGLRLRFVSSLPLTVAALASWWLGTVYELARRR
jgi:glycosyltransferase involved in cell wall biosynthesis